eukprot:3904956-Karenia_brevis.AAC.1
MAPRCPQDASKEAPSSRKHKKNQHVLTHALFLAVPVDLRRQVYVGSDSLKTFQNVLEGHPCAQHNPGPT